MARNHPSLNFSPHPGLITALSEILSLAPHQAHSPCENSGLSVVPPPWLLKQHRNIETYRSQLQAGSPACKQHHSFRPVERSSNCAPSQGQDRIGRKFPLGVQSVEERRGARAPDSVVVYDSAARPIRLVCCNLSFARAMVQGLYSLSLSLRLHLRPA